MDRMKEADVDFIVQLGDFCFPIPENEEILRIWNQFDGPKFHFLGNHDMKTIQIEGIQSGFSGPSPQERGYEGTICGHEITAAITTRMLAY